jgi:eukaryotic-like serine/threonine-protein kinase
MGELIEVAHPYAAPPVPSRSSAPPRSTSAPSIPVVPVLSSVRSLDVHAATEAVKTPTDRSMTVTPARGGARRRAWVFAGAGGVVAVVIGLAAFGFARQGGTPRGVAASKAAGPSPLASGGALACPQLAVSGVEEPAGWLGAAAAAFACERARMLLGGGTDRVLVPAELSSLPSEPVDAFPRDPFGEPGSRDRELDQARSRAVAYLDGTVEKQQDRLRVSLVLRGSQGNELGRGEGSATLLFRAVREAMDAMGKAAFVPAGPPSAFLAEWYGTRSTDAALALADYEGVWRLQDGRSGAEECARLGARTDFEPAMAAFLSISCSEVNRTPSPDPPSVDVSRPAGLLTGIAAISHAHRAVDQGDGLAARLDAFAQAEQRSEPRSLLACAQLYLPPFSRDLRRRSEAARQAIQRNPKLVDARCDGWRWLLFSTQRMDVARAMEAWVPWDPYGYEIAAEFEPSVDERIRVDRRAYLLAPQGRYSSAIAERLLEAGLLEEAHAVSAVDMTARLRILLDASEARFAAALDEARTIFEGVSGSHPGEDAFHAASGAVEAALILGRPLDFAMPLVDKYLGDVPGFAASDVAGALAVCTFGPSVMGARCLGRLRAVFAEGRFANPAAGLDSALQGAERYTRGDYRGAADAWRPLMRIGTGFYVAALRHAMADAFDRGGAPELAEKLDAATLSHPGSFNGADLAFVRQARRAQKRGDHAQAQALAKKVVDAWQVADTTVPVVAEMKAILAKGS